MTTVAAPGVQGAGITGRQGMGVSTPIAAAVAAATAGLLGVQHIPKGTMLTIGTQSKMLAAGVGAAIRFKGSTFNTLGAMPKEH
jgi:hypothetical protein